MVDFWRFMFGLQKAHLSEKSTLGFEAMVFIQAERMEE
jgi:hypothetical protein